MFKTWPLTNFVIVIWMISLVTGVFAVSPDTDDGFQALIPFLFYEEHSIGMSHLGEFYRIFYGPPGATFIQSIFHYPIIASGVEYGVFISKLHLLVICGLVVMFLAILMKRLSKNTTPATDISVAIGLAILGVLPYGAEVINIRPEPAGILALLTALLLLDSEWRTASRSTFKLAGAGFALGVSAITHPSFVVVAGGVGLVALYLVARRAGYLAAMIGVLAALTPILAIVIWFGVHFTESWPAISAHVAERSLGTAPFGHGLALMVEKAAGVFSKASYASLALLHESASFFLLTFVVVTAAVLIALRLLSKRARALNETEKLVMAVFVIGLINLEMNSSARAQIFVVTSFGAALAFCSFFPTSSITEFIKTRSVVALIAVVLVFAVMATPLMHTAKHFIGDKERFHPWPLSQALRAELREGDRLFFSDDRFIPAFLDYVAGTIRGDSPVEAYWIFPHLIADPELEEWRLKKFACLASSEPGRRTFWAISDNIMESLDEKTRIAIVKVDEDRIIRVVFRYNKIVYQVHNAVVLGGNIEHITELIEAGGKRILYSKGQELQGC